MATDCIVLIKWLYSNTEGDIPLFTYLFQFYCLYKLTRPCSCSSFNHHKAYSTNLPQKLWESLNIQDGIQLGRHFDWVWHFKDKPWQKHWIVTIFRSYEWGIKFFCKFVHVLGCCDNSRDKIFISKIPLFDNFWNKTIEMQDLVTINQIRNYGLPWNVR